MSHSYKNPSKERLDLAKVEAGGDDEGFGFAGAKTIIDENGWRQRAPVSDRECIYKCLDNCEQLAGLDRKQVQRLMKEFESGQKGEDVVDLISEYPPL